MPIYEYVYEEPGKTPVVIEMLRSIADADKPVPDPENKGRVFKRKLSMFATGGGATPGASPSSGHIHSGSCGCGKRRGSCGM